MNLLLAGEFVNGLLVFFIGMIVVFLGMALIVLIISLIGKIMHATTNKEIPNSKEEVITAQVAPAKVDNEVDEDVRAAIFAAIAAYYFDMGSGCEFKIKRIKRI